MKLLIITVGNRQVGWRCKDGIVRCLGISSNPRDATPDHVTELYSELEVEKPKSKYYVRDLGKLFYEKCNQEQDFSSVELLLDRVILDRESENGLEEVWLIGTDQPAELVAQEFRSGDTLWLTELMAGKIQHQWKNLRVKNWNLKINANDIDQIRAEYEQFILKYLIEKNNSEDNDTILIENKGSVPAMASSLEICMAALVRQFEIIRLTPIEPSPMFVGNSPAQMSAASASEFREQSMSQYFFPLEKSRIISAWERGDFGEAKVWLEGHKNRYFVLFKLVGYLEQALGYDIKSILQEMKGQWLPTKKLKQLAQPELIEAWCKYECLDKYKTSAIIWEYAFQIPIWANSGRLTNAFFLMAQTLERLLYQLYRKDKWLENGWISIPENMIARGIGKDSFNPRLEEMIKVWGEHYNSSDSFCKLLNNIRERRNKIIHDAVSISIEEVRDMWNEAGIKVEPIGEALLIPLQKVNKRIGNLPEKPLLLSLYEWGLTQFRY